MEHKVEWLTEEEGRITFSEQGTIYCTMQFFVTGEEEAEFRIQDVVFDEKQMENREMHKEIISKMTKCISEGFRLLWEEGLEETVLVEQNGTKLLEILDSTTVVHLAYKEYMMKCRYETQESTGCGQTFLKLTKEDGGFSCENEDQTFFCRLLNYEAENPGERCFYLYEVEVKEEKRNQGIATACLKELFRQLSEEGPVVIYLQVGSYNEPAVHLYEKSGFEISEELRYYAMEE